MGMDIFEEKSISSAKQEFPSIVREAVKGYEVIASNFKSSKDDKVSIISTAIFEEILDRAYKFHPMIEEDEAGGGYTISLEDLLIHGDGPTLAEALQDLAENLMDYTLDYLKRIYFFRQIDNRKDHYPYLRRIAKCGDLKQVMEVIAECHTGLQQAISSQLPPG
jgi:AcrR family transcriptional regulator